MQNLKVAELASAETVLHITDGAKRGILEQANENTSHKDIRPTEIVKSEEDTNALKQAVESFSNPFNIDNKGVLYCLSPGAPALKDVEEDLLNADDIGQDVCHIFVADRQVFKETSFNAPIKKQKLSLEQSLSYYVYI